MGTTRRRAFLAAAAALLLASPLALEAQPAPRVHRVAILGVPTAVSYAQQFEAFRAGLRDHGYVEGRNLAIEARWADGDSARLPALAAELVALKPDVLVTSGPGTSALKRATSTIPIVMSASGDAVAAGLVQSLARPGGNVTGSSFFFAELNAKRIELLKETLPRIRRVGVLANPSSPGFEALLRVTQDTARALKVELQVAEARTPADIEGAVGALANARVEALAVVDNSMFVSEAARIATLASKHRLPAIGFVEIADQGGLLAYGVNFHELWRRAATFVDKILKGARPADLPVEQPTRFEVVVNQKAAQALGVSVPRIVLLRADRVID